MYIWVIFLAGMIIDVRQEAGSENITVRTDHGQWIKTIGIEDIQAIGV